MDIPVIDERCQRVTTFFSLLDLVNSPAETVEQDDLEHLGVTLRSLWDWKEITMVCQIWSDLNKNETLMKKALPFVEVTGSLLGRWAVDESMRKRHYRGEGYNV